MFSIKRHTNGGLTVNLPLALLMAFLTIMGLIITPAISLGIMQEKVNNIETRLDAVSPEHEQRYGEINTRLRALEDSTIETQTSIKNIEKNIDEMKLDIKEIRKQVTE